MTPTMISSLQQLQRAGDSYRGQGVNVAQANNDPSQILSMAGLNWRVGQTNVGAIGKREVKTISGYKANVRSDNGEVLAVVSDSYRPHHNTQLIGTMAKFADAAGMKIVRAGTFDGGVHVWAAAETGIQSEVRRGDIVKLQIVMRSSHDGTSASIYRAMAIRLACLNGMTVTEGAGSVRFVHSTGISEAKADQVASYMDQTGQGFRAYIDAMARLYTVRSTPTIDRLILLELVAPELLQSVHDRLHRVSNLTPASSTPTNGQLSLDTVIRAASLRDDSLEIVQGMIDQSRTRTAKLLDAVIDRQQGGSLSQSTLAHVVNAVSAYQTHVRGDNESGVNNLMFTPGQDMARSAMDTATRWATVIEQATR